MQLVGPNDSMGCGPRLTDIFRKPLSSRRFLPREAADVRRVKGPLPLLARIQERSDQCRVPTTIANSVLDEPVADEAGEIQVCIGEYCRLPEDCRLTPLPSALGISHSLGHKLGARFSIPHGITSVSDTSVV